MANPHSIGPNDPFDSLKRYCTVRNCLDSPRRSTVPPVQFAFETLRAAKNPSSTEWSIVYDFERERIHFRTRSHPQVREINLTSLDFSVSNAVRMFDVQSTYDGDVTGRFRDYSHDETYTHFLSFTRNYCAYWKLPLPADLEGWVDRSLRQLECDIVNR